MSKRAKAYGLLTITVILWGISGPIAKYALESFTPQALLTARFGLITLILAILLKFQLKIPLLPKKNRLTFCLSISLLGFLGTVGQIGLIYWGLQHTSSIEATLLISTSPILVALISHILIGEQITSKKLLGISLGLLGTAIIVLGPLLREHKFLTGSNLGNMLILGGNLCWSFYAVLSKKQLRTKMSPMLLTFWMFFIGFLGMAFISLITHTNLPTFTLPRLGSIAFLAIGPGIIAYLCYQTALKSISPTDADVFNYLTPIVATPLGFFWLHEPITYAFILGSVIIALGVIIAEFSRR